MTAFTSDEKRLIEHAKKSIIKYNKMRESKGGLNTLYSFLLSDSRKIYDGACLETNIGSANICAERHAVANMVLKESYKAKVKCIVVADPVPDVQKIGTTPCGTCRHILWERGTPSTSILLIQYIREKSGWTFPKIQKLKLKDLYPYPYTPIEWD
jgi:cytidine deaminase